MARRHQIFALTYTAYAVIYVSRKALSVVKTLIQEDLGISAYGLGTIDSAFLGTYAIFQVFLPSLSDYRGVRPVLVASFVGAAVFCLLFGLGQSAQALTAAWLCEGISHAAVFAVLIKAVSLWFPAPRRSAMLGFWTTSQQVGAIVATMVATYVSTHFGWRAVFYVAAIITAAAALLIYVYLPEPPEAIPCKIQSLESVELTAVDVPPKRRKYGKLSSAAADEDRASSTRSASSPPPGASLDMDIEEPSPAENGSVTRLTAEGSDHAVPPCPPRGFWDVVRVPGLLLCGVAYFCVKLVRYALLFWLPFFLVTQKGLTPAIAGYSSMLFDAGGVAGAIATGYMIQTVFRGHKFVATACLCIATGCALIVLAFTALPPEVTGAADLPPDFTTTLALMAIVGFLIAGPDSVLGASAAADVCERTPGANDRLSTATGIVNGLGSFGGVAQGYVTAVISETLGWPALFIALGCACFGGTVALLPVMWADPKRRIEPKHQLRS